MNRLVLIAISGMILSACVAETVERRRPRKGPIQEVGYVEFGGGRVRYSAEGWSWAVSSRRRTALKLMSRNCGRELSAHVIDEFVRTDADAKYAGEDIAASMSHGDEHFVVEHYVHMSYECRPAGWVEPVASTSVARPPLMVIPPVPEPSK